MATISAGLAATIREWFSEGENVTTVETAEKVDLDEVRVAESPGTRRWGPESPSRMGEETEIAVMEPDELPRRADGRGRA